LYKFLFYAESLSIVIDFDQHYWNRRNLDWH